MAETQRVAISTGAAGGIGRAMTEVLLQAGIQVACVDRDREALEALAADARERGKATELLPGAVAARLRPALSYPPPSPIVVGSAYC